MQTPQIPVLFMTELKVEKFAELVSWYQKVLGLKLELMDEPRGFALLSSGPNRLALKRSKDQWASGVRLVFQIKEIEAEHVRIRELQPDVGAIENDPEGFRSFKLLDPQGVAITLFAWHE